ncbi:MAG: GT-D fold domain-containing protein [Lachnospiraceae bacterium]|nr:GT-D fold domain-containing protein [Lachnospiraceae bacterium]
MAEKRVNASEPFIKTFLKRILEDLDYGLYRAGLKKMHPHIRVMSIDETIDEMLNTKKSLVRFGDGEVAMMRGVNLKLQQVSPGLVDRMKDIIGYHDEDLAVSVQDIFDGLSLYVPASRRFWRSHLFVCRKFYEKLCNPDRVYASTAFSRCYITIDDKSQCAGWFEKIRSIWKDRDVTVVEGPDSWSGVCNDLLSEAASVRRILGPARNAWDRYDEILSACREEAKGQLFLLALGPCAKPLAEDLFHEGYRVIDIGNMEIEYTWFLMGATDKSVGHAPMTEEQRALYESQIVKRIGA